MQPEIRDQLFREFAQTKQWEYHGIPAFDNIPLLNNFELFKKGGRKKVLRQMYRSTALMDHQMYCFDYSYVISTGKSSITYKQTVLFIDDKRCSIPQFLVRPTSLWDRVLSFLGFHDIPFPSNPKFSDMYYVKGTEPQLIYALFNDHIPDALSTRPGWHMEGMGYYLILYKHNVLLHTHEIEQAVSIMQILQNGFHSDLFSDPVTKPI